MPVNPELLRQEIEQIVDIATSDVILEKLNQFWELRQNFDINSLAQAAAEEFSIEAIAATGLPLPSNLRISSRVFEPNDPSVSLEIIDARGEFLQPPGGPQQPPPEVTGTTVFHSVRFPPEFLNRELMDRVRAGYRIDQVVDFVNTVTDDPHGSAICVCIGGGPCIGIGG
ncbi:hypothetical protein [Mesorhizobium sp.]|uniref:hypothetical protein n=1 Tax=Mesorhizobium sp. TaxID=1871066 RepID=UPI001212EEFB|nr:hypothetical protein [Mesorhizobium sp.]TIN24032.1 MAG: hypothetical protein E5Y19_24210 [Mesorhizobium sp.]